MNPPEYLIPAKELLVRHPSGGHLKAEGEYVVIDSYWRRRLAEKSVTRSHPPKTSKPVVKE